MGERIPQGLRLACCTRNRRDETVAAARHVRHIACAARSLLPKRLAQRQDMKAKAALIDHKVGPDFCDQFLLANHSAGRSTRATRMSRARLPSRMRTPPFSRTLSVTERRKGPKQITS